MISSKSECENAATDLNLNDASATEFKITNRPTGCILNPNSGWLGWNTDTNNDVPCGSVDSHNKKTYNCICKTGKSKHFHTCKKP